VTDEPLVRAVLPGLAERIETALRAQGEERIADQVSGLRITRVCSCDEPSCGSFHTSSPPMKRWFMRGRQIEVRDDGPGAISVDVVRGEIAYIEVLSVDEVREALARLPT
jgi:hypothetical protein